MSTALTAYAEHVMYRSVYIRHSPAVVRDPQREGWQLDAVEHLRSISLGTEMRFIHIKSQ